MTSTDLESTTIESASTAFAALGDPVRLRVIGLLHLGERCVCELQEEIGIASNLLSYHLRVLREAGLIEGSRRGRWIDYRLNQEGLAALRSTLGEG